METRKGIFVDVLRNASYDCTLNGLSSKHNRVFLIGEGVREQFKQDDSKPVFKLVKRHIFGEDYYHAEPLEKPKRGAYMFGGNYITVSRHEAPVKHPIPVHDRSE